MVYERARRRKRIRGRWRVSLLSRMWSPCKTWQKSISMIWSFITLGHVMHLLHIWSIQNHGQEYCPCTLLLPGQRRGFGKRQDWKICSSQSVSQLAAGSNNPSWLLDGWRSMMWKGPGLSGCVELGGGIGHLPTSSKSSMPSMGPGYPRSIQYTICTGRWYLIPVYHITCMAGWTILAIRLSISNMMGCHLRAEIINSMATMASHWQLRQTHW